MEGEKEEGMRCCVMATISGLDGFLRSTIKQLMIGHRGSAQNRNTRCLFIAGQQATIRLNASLWRTASLLLIYTTIQLSARGGKQVRSLSFRANRNHG